MAIRAFRADPRFQGGRARAEVAADLFQVAAHREIGVEGVVLRADAHSPGGRFGVGAAVDPGHANRAGVGLQKTVAQSQGRGFTGPVGAQQAQHLAGPPPQTDPIDDAATGELFDETVGQQDRLVLGVRMARTHWHGDNPYRSVLDEMRTMTIREVPAKRFPVGTNGNRSGLVYEDALAQPEDEHDATN